MQIGLALDRRMGEAARRLLLSEGLLDTSKRIVCQGEELILPIKPGLEEKLPHSLRDRGRLVRRPFESLGRRPSNIAEALSGILSEGEIRRLGRSYDMVGRILVIAIPEELYPKRRQIGAALLEWLRVDTVACKVSAVSGEYRVRSLEVIAGSSSLETLHRENGLRFRLDLSKVFFNPRLASERWRVALLARDDQQVLDMFAGVGPFSISIARASTLPGRRIVAIDKNREAVRYLGHNVGLNKAWAVRPILADSGLLVAAFAKRGVLFDRVIMNLPWLAHMFVETAASVLREHGYLHYYRLLPKGEESRVIPEELGSGFDVEQIRCVEDYSPSSSIFVADAVRLR